MTAAARHAEVRAPANEPCPFCGSGGIALAKLARRRKTSRVKRSSRPCDCAFCEEGRRVPHTVPQIVAFVAPADRPFRPHDERAGVTNAAEVSAAYQAHLDAGEVAVPDVAAGGYRWEKGGNAA